MGASACYLYVLPLAYEDFLKIGISADPLVRVQAFSRRYYDSFDLARSLLVGFDARREARARETQLHRRLRPWRATKPLTVSLAAAGHTEWYRGAYAEALREVDADRARGFEVHAAGADWWRGRLLRDRDALFEWASRLQSEMEAGIRPATDLQRLADALDAWTSVGIAVEAALPDDVARWYTRYRERRSARLAIGD